MQYKFAITSKTLIQSPDFLIWRRSEGLIHIYKQLLRGHQLEELFDEVNEPLDGAGPLHAPLLGLHDRRVPHSLQQDVNFLLGVLGRFLGHRGAG